MPKTPLILAIETSCDETAVAVLDGDSRVLASEIASQIALHQAYGGVVPEVASRNHLLQMRTVVEQALDTAAVSLKEIDVFAATAGPGLAGSLLIGNTTAKGFALAHRKTFIALNHMEGHLLSPFLGQTDGIEPCIALVVSGGHTLLIHLRAFGDYELVGSTCDDAAGEAFDKVAKMLGLPYPGGPEIEKTALTGDPKAYAFPRSMLNRPSYDFSFSGLKTSVLYQIDKLDRPLDACLADLCASFQEAVVDVLVRKTVRLAHEREVDLITVSGGVSCNTRLRDAFREAASASGRRLLVAERALTTDNAAMIGYVALEKYRRGEESPLENDVDPNLRMITRS